MDDQNAVNLIGPLVRLAMLAAIVAIVVVRARRPVTGPPVASWNTLSLKLGVVGILLVLAMAAFTTWFEVEPVADLLGLAMLFILVLGLVQGVVDGIRGVRREKVEARLLAWAGLLVVLLAWLILWVWPR